MLTTYYKNCMYSSKSNFKAIARTIITFPTQWYPRATKLVIFLAKEITYLTMTMSSVRCLNAKNLSILRLVSPINQVEFDPKLRNFV